MEDNNVFKLVDKSPLTLLVAISALITLLLINQFAVLRSVDVSVSDTIPLDILGSVIINPEDDIQAIVDSNLPGTKYILRTGTYRLQKITPHAGDIFIGEAGAVLNGSIELQNFQNDGNLWKITGQSQEEEINGICKPEYPRCSWSNELFINDVRQRQVNSINEVTQGTWFFDYTEDTIYIGENPDGKTVETSVIDFAFMPNGKNNNVTIKNLQIEKYANPAQLGTINGYISNSEFAAGWIIENNKFINNHGIGINLYTNWTVRKNLITRNGQLGIQGRGLSATVETNEISYNNAAGFDSKWEVGGARFSETLSLNIKDNYSHNNLGPGLWTEIDNLNTIYDSNTVVYNDGIGIQHEISYDAKIKNNFVLYNGAVDSSGLLVSQISIQNSSNVEVFNNIIASGVGGADGILIENEARGFSTATTGIVEFGKPRISINNYVHNNAIYNEDSEGTSSGIIISEESDSHYLSLVESTNEFNYNTYYIPVGTEMNNEKNGTIITQYSMPVVPTWSTAVGPLAFAISTE